MPRERKRLLFSLAHPDDESFGFGGTIARYSHNGVEVHLICATNGDVGTIDPKYMDGFASTAERRLYELDCAASVLGLKLHLLGYRDSGMAGTPDNEHPNALAAQDVEAVAARVAGVIRAVRPQVVVTFDPSGGYFHPDHIAIHKATVRAVEAAGDKTRFPVQLEAGLQPYQPQRLFQSTNDLRSWRFLIRLAPLFGLDPTRMGRNKDMNFKAIFERETAPVHAVIATSKYRDITLQAWECHASQRFDDGGNFVQWAVRRMLRGNNYYSRVYPPVNGDLRVYDLFDGVLLEEESQGVPLTVAE